MPAPRLADIAWRGEGSGLAHLSAFELTSVRHRLSIFCVKTTDLTITELAREAPKAIRQTEEIGIRGITRNGKSVAFLVSRSVMESILETMELQKNRKLMDLVKADKAGRVAYTPMPSEG